MPKLTMTKGLPGSGKSTWARAQVIASDGQTKRVNKDDLRAMLDAGQWSKHNEKNILAVRDLLIEDLLHSKFNVIVDDTNLAPKHEARLREIAREMRPKYGIDVSFAIQDFTDVPIETCIKRDLERFESVGEKVIRKMWKQFLFEPVKDMDPVEWVEGLPTAIIVDIDGTVAQMVSRGPHDYDRVIEDAPKERVIQQVRRWVLDQMRGHPNDWHLIFCSGRPDSCREDTEAWLKEHVLKSLGILAREWSLFMRPTYLPQRRESDGKQIRDHRNDAVVKKEIYDNQIKGKFNIDFVLDDRNRVVDMWREQGLLCLQVAPGDF